MVRETAREEFERTAESGACAQAALRDLAEHQPRLLADTIAYLTGAAREVAAAAVRSVRLGYGLDDPFMRALKASAHAAGRAS